MIQEHLISIGGLIEVSFLLQVLVVPMLAPRSYTREDVVELQCHGGDVCVRQVLQLCIQAGARLAQPGVSLIPSTISMSLTKS